LSTPSIKNISLFRKQKPSYGDAIPRLMKEGVSRSSRHVVREAMDEAALRDEHAEADGEIVWS
jgi:phage baseplate assembly protein W